MDNVYRLDDYRPKDIVTCPYCGEKVDRTDWKDTLSWTCAVEPGPNRHVPLRAKGLPA
jgi:hypothetical protein